MTENDTMVHRNWKKMTDGTVDKYEFRNIYGNAHPVCPEKGHKC